MGIGTRNEASSSSIEPSTSPSPSATATTTTTSSLTHSQPAKNSTQFFRKPNQKFSTLENIWHIFTLSWKIWRRRKLAVRSVQNLLPSSKVCDNTRTNFYSCCWADVYVVKNLFHFRWQLNLQQLSVKEARIFEQWQPKKRINTHASEREKKKQKKWIFVTEWPSIHWQSAIFFSV